MEPEGSLPCSQNVKNKREIQPRWDGGSLDKDDGCSTVQDFHHFVVSTGFQWLVNSIKMVSV